MILYFIYKILPCLCVATNKFVLIIISPCYMYIKLNGKTFFYLLNHLIIKSITKSFLHQHLPRQYFFSILYQYLICLCHIPILNIILFPRTFVLISWSYFFKDSNLRPFKVRELCSLIHWKNNLTTRLYIHKLKRQFLNFWSLYRFWIGIKPYSFVLCYLLI